VHPDGKHLYLGTGGGGDRMYAVDISDPSNPVVTDSLMANTRRVNDIMTTPDGKYLVHTREGAADRKNGIVIASLEDPAHPKVISEFTEGVTGGVHSAFIYQQPKYGTHIYLTNDATGVLHIVDINDPYHPKEVARFSSRSDQQGNYVHDVDVKDGLAYLSYWNDGLVIIDVGNGIKGGSPEHPQFVSQLRFNYSELYGPGWLAGAHSVFRYKNYVFLGDEVFPAQYDLTDKARIPTKGVVHVVDVSDILNPRKVAEYDVPEEGAHNMWVENDVMYIGYYSGGARAVDVSGELRGNLYRQGREMARLWTGDAKGFRPNIPFAWGAQPHKGLIYFNDIHTGLWVTKLIDPAERAK